MSNLPPEEMTAHSGTVVGLDQPIDQDDSATWRQLRDRLREIRAWAAEHDAADLLALLDRPRETL